MANVSWSISIQVAGGPTVTAREGPIPAEATDRIEVSIAAGEEDKEVSLQPGPASGIHLLLIKSSQYSSDEDDEEKITFTVASSTNPPVTDTIVLSGPQFYSGGAVERLGSDLKSLKFTNKSDEPAQIEIFIARDATPEPSS